MHLFYPDSRHLPGGDSTQREAATCDAQKIVVRPAMSAWFSNVRIPWRQRTTLEWYEATDAGTSRKESVEAVADDVVKQDQYFPITFQDKEKLRHQIWDAFLLDQRGKDLDSYSLTTAGT